MKRFVNAVCCLGFATGLVVACGGATTDSGSFSSGLPPNEGLRELSSTDTANLCDSLMNYLRDRPGDPYCRFSGFATASATADVFGSMTDAELRKACADAQSLCDAQTTGSSDRGVCEIPKLGPSCTATISEYEACVSEEIETLTRALSSVPSCSTLTRADLDASPTNGLKKGDLLSGPSCQRMRQHCPEAFGGSGSTTTVTVGNDGGLTGTGTGWVDAGPPIQCGNGVRDPGEDCDSIITDATCASVTMALRPNGTLRCFDCHYDLTGCTM